MSKTRLLRAIQNQTSIDRLNYLKTTGLTIIINAAPKDVTESDRTEIEAAINARIAELS